MKKKKKKKKKKMMMMMNCPVLSGQNKLSA
jgi:hypothetical protein